MKEKRSKLKILVFFEKFSFLHVYFYSSVLNFYLLIHNKNFISLINWENTSLHFTTPYNAMSRA